MRDSLGRAQGIPDAVKAVPVGAGERGAAADAVVDVLEEGELSLLLVGGAVGLDAGEDGLNLRQLPAAQGVGQEVCPDLEQGPALRIGQVPGRVEGAREDRELQGEARVVREDLGEREAALCEVVRDLSDVAYEEGDAKDHVDLEREADCGDQAQDEAGLDDPDNGPEGSVHRLGEHGVEPVRHPDDHQDGREGQDNSAQPAGLHVVGGRRRDGVEDGLEHLVCVNATSCVPG